MSESLTSKSCKPCREGQEPLKGEALDVLKQQLPDGWCVVDEHHLEKEFSFDDFKQALNFTNKVGAVAEAEGHHPDLELGYGRVKITMYTHKIGGLSESDFIFAAKADEEC